MSQEEMVKKALDNILSLIHSQREGLFEKLDVIPAYLLWKKPSKEEWSIGENLDHLRVIYKSWMGFVKASWFFFAPIARLQRDRSIRIEIDNVYRRPGFPQKVGWMWPPYYTPGRPAAYDFLKQNLVITHQQVEKFYLARDVLLLGNVTLYDPAIGNLNLIQALRVAVYHDEMHIEQILQTLTEIMN